MRTRLLLTTALLLAGGAGAAWWWSRDPTPRRQRTASAAEYVNTAEGLLRQGRLTEAVVSLNRAIAVAPRDGQAYIRLAVIYEGLNRSDLAIDALRQLEVANPHAEHLPCRLAEAYLGAEDVKGARELGERAVAEEPQCARAFSVFGIASARYRFWGTAAEALEQAQQLAPEDDGIPETLIEVYLQQNQFERAIETARRLLGRNARSAVMEYKLGFAHARLPQTPETTEAAIRHLRRAGELDPRWFEPHAELGRLYSSLGRAREAATAFEEAWRLNDGVPGVAFNLAKAYRQLKDPRAATMDARFRSLLAGQTKFSQLRTNYNTWPDQAGHTLALAESEARAGLYAPALHRLRKLLAKDPADQKALQLFMRIDRAARHAQPEYLRPGPGIAPATM